MRNLLALLAAALLTFLVVGWYLDWYKVKNDPAPAGHHNVHIDINGNKIAEDVQKGVVKGEEKLQGVLDKEKKTSTQPNKPANAPEVPAKDDSKS
ncbi:MAG TPA: hypothetical protein VGY77_04150 [Gemmataceae bacterium]|jgi:hypothetical protein|nr:hypothetical protein [Gemmataceae bacterium]